MENFYINKIKNIVMEYADTEKDIAKQIKSNNGFYSQAEAERQNAVLISRSDSEYQRAISLINSTFKEIRAKLANCTRLQITELSGTEVKNAIGFFNGQYPVSLTPDDIKNFINDYKNNFTMCRILNDYIDKNFDDDVTTKAMLKAELPTPRTLCEKYKSVCQSAINQIGAVHSNPATVVSFNVTADTLELLGSANNILTISAVNPPNTFDDIVLIKEYGNSFEELK